MFLNNQKAFTMIEMVAAIFVVNLGIMAVFSLITQSITHINSTASSLTATYLAQEGIEIARNIRDGNFLKMDQDKEASWNDNLSTDKDYYNFDYKSESIPDNTNCDGKTHLQISNGYYTCSSYSPAVKFQRKIRISPVGEDKIEVLVEVSWTERGKTNNVSAQETLYRWFSR